MEGGAQGDSANGNREKNDFSQVFLKYYISFQIQFGILLFSRQNMH